VSDDPIAAVVADPGQVRLSVARQASRGRLGVGWLVWLALFGLALAFIAAIIRPIDSGPTTSDAAASVLYFDRIVAGQRLEAFVNSTSKPLLTVVYGLGYSLTHDWRFIAISSIVAAAAAVALGARLAHRASGAGPAVAVAIVLASLGTLLNEVSWGYAVPWALACWFLAGLALTRERPSFVVAGLALMVGALARPETYLVTAVATVCLARLAVRHRFPTGGAWLLTGWLAVPVICVHDLLLTGDPLFWLRVATIYADGIRTSSAARVAYRIVTPLVSTPLITLAAIGGVVALSRTRAGRIVAAGVVTIGLGTAALLVAIAIRHLATPNYYLDPILVAIAFAAAVGVGTAATFIGSRLDGWLAGLAAGSPFTAPTRHVRTTVFEAVAAIGLTLLILRPVLATVRTVHYIDVQRQIAADSDAAAGIIGGLVAERGIAAEPPGDPGRFADPSRLRILVPRPLQTRLAVTLGLPVTVIGASVPDHPMSGLVHPGLILFRDRLTEQDGGLPTQFDGTTPISVDGVTFDPVLADPATGRWIWKSSDP
jgi:hypothetical protein